MVSSPTTNACLGGGDLNLKYNDLPQERAFYVKLRYIPKDGPYALAPPLRLVIDKGVIVRARCVAKHIEVTCIDYANNNDASMRAMNSKIKSDLLAFRKRCDLLRYDGTTSIPYTLKIGNIERVYTTEELLSMI